ncbi:3-hydroxyisobutyrate dehydrogenase [Candidatus Acidianus copahuensis]|uniref:3-hydroxyisobutyrate dehydrogenase n=1 Tax=Candidatus Acidianus copahuensis TaxID=1160895 RepID=A0A031LPV0_9CREN|nr:NAD(P)-dependent oxidoreductase [Candidatus Acidianus copahuensis]EZQ06775.1 3-hydroxyisobutyrate dehydrogenase [Candidatus Acidianus copahuensis]
MNGLIGLGVMGWRIGANLAKDGVLGLVWDRTEDKAKEFSRQYKVKFGGLQEIANECEIVLTMLSDDDAVTTVVENLIPHLKGKILVDMSTISPSVSLALAKKVKEVGGVMYDAPVIGTSVFVEQKKLVVMVGGPEDQFSKVKDLLSHTSSSVIYMGDNGMGLYAKLVNNLLLGVYATAMAEAYNFGISSGLDKEKVAKVLSELSSARSPTTELKVPKMVSEDYSTQFAVKHMRKDLEIIQRESQRIRALTLTSSLSLQLYRMAEALGLGEKDFIGVLEVFRKLSPGSTKE